MNDVRYRWRLLVGGYLLLEIGAAMLVADAIGWGWTMLLLLAGLPIGLAILPRNPAAGALIAVPGFISDAAGLLLLVPPVRARAGSALEGWLRRKLRFASATIVQGEVVVDAPNKAPADAFPGDVVQGEIVQHPDGRRSDARGERDSTD